MSAPKFIFLGLLASCCWKTKKAEVSDTFPIISRSAQSQQGWLNVHVQEKAFQLCRFLISCLTCHQVSCWRLWTVHQRQKGSRLCDLSPEWQQHCQPGGGCHFRFHRDLSSCSCCLRENQMHQDFECAVRFARNVQTLQLSCRILVFEICHKANSNLGNNMVTLSSGRRALNFTWGFTHSYRQFLWTSCYK